MAAGAVMRIIGGVLQAKAAKMAQKKAGEVAQTPGLDIGAVVNQRLKEIEGSLPEANKIASMDSQSRQALENLLVEQSMPGFTAGRDAATAQASKLAAGQMPDWLQNELKRGAAASMMTRGFGQSGIGLGGIGGNQAMSQFFTGGMQAQQTGINWLSALRGMSPVVTPTSAMALTGPSPEATVGIRGDERLQKMQMLMGIAGMPGATAMWGNHLMESGAMLAGMGGGMMGGGGDQKQPNQPTNYQPYQPTQQPVSSDPNAGSYWGGGGIG